ncbi:hypothetical protein PV666_40750 [Streptomyces acidiscabies]|uniref:Uncharacterized protein n=1 Tax=Streptomyces acidiscabies TaxID=42234 RepID=A0AAP6B870_9ACTN|nr:hypothetical protein [Streptomyces acidiscabies]MDX2959951.1 hypothetical protein [Streptomyces acidiscabies]MDX3024158.1 hypothetical protein [Streptomyces acidiscabies]MDX3794581.1 hypothetical protein [Streptomyces acidiscabies]
MTPTYSTPGRHRQRFAPTPFEFLPAGVESPSPPDPPIYLALMRTWADRGRTLPGHHDPEWSRLAAPQVRPGQFGGLPGDEFPAGR